MDILRSITFTLLLENINEEKKLNVDQWTQETGQGQFWRHLKQKYYPKK